MCFWRFSVIPEVFVFLYMTKQENFDIVYKCEKSDCEELRNGYIDCYVYRDFSRKSFNSCAGRKENEYLSLFCTFILIFSMGVMLGKKDHFFEELSSLGLTSFLFFLIPTVLSIGLVYWLTRVFMKKDK